MDLNTPIKNLKGIGPIFQKKLRRIKIETVKDLIYHFPHRYEDFSNIKRIGDITPGEKVCVVGRVITITKTRTPKKGMTIVNATISDGDDSLNIIWFNQPYITNTIQVDDIVSLVGKVDKKPEGFVMTSPIVEKPLQNELKHGGRLVPVYPETEGLSSRWLRGIIKSNISYQKEFLPKDIIKKEGLMEINKALDQIHFPDSLELAEKARIRFSFEELFLFQLQVLREKVRIEQEEAPKIETDVKIIKRFLAKLPFQITDAQKKCSWQILKDLERGIPMSRLMQGDVGSGKTLVAVLTSLNTIKQGYQVAIMAPTEILAKQHFKSVEEMLRGFNIKIGLLTGKQDKVMSKKLPGETIEISRNRLIEKTKEGEIQLLIGTHTLIQDKVKFGNLGLCVIDEQHRFGVNQRKKLTTKNNIVPHLLSMTATPIPRSLALTIYGDLDVSVIDEMPEGRLDIITKIIKEKERDNMYQFTKERLINEEQVFVICPKIEKTEDKDSMWAEVKSAEEEYEKISEIFDDFRVALIHGKMKPKDKDKIMRDFKWKKIDILVSTSVVEVGVDIPDATIMIIEGADRFGMAQLHQFRGRVGRSNKQSYCFLLTNSRSQKTKSRLSSIEKNTDGFKIAESDLRLRGPGTFYGIKQSGMPDFIMKNLTNTPLIEKTREYAKEIIYSDPNFKKYPELRNKIVGLDFRLHLE